MELVVALHVDRKVHKILRRAKYEHEKLQSVD
jgi:hypothetical protein